MYESEDDAFYEMKDEMPFDVNADVIDIKEDDFGLWYVDMIDHQSIYDGKTLHLTGRIQKAKGLEAGYVIFGRHAMTCCADDVQFIGFLCKADDWSGFANGSYVTITEKRDLYSMPKRLQPLRNRKKNLYISIRIVIYCAVFACRMDAALFSKFFLCKISYKNKGNEIKLWKKYKIFQKCGVIGHKIQK